MDVFARSSSFSSSSPSSSGRRGSQSRGHRGTASKIIERVICATLTCVFAAVGSLVGAVTGALIGLATESGLLREPESEPSPGQFSASKPSNHLSICGTPGSPEFGAFSMCLLSGRIIREKVDPAMQSAVQSQMSAADLPSIENSDLFATDSTGGLPADAVEKLPKTNITAESLEAAGESLCCSVCLQDFQVGETARRLPHCQHTFHLPCIDAWLVRHGSCPLCRRDVDVPFAL
ncbi:RING [Musa troglodytarum]|uniref:RING n=1 Tax=Musa troglodytarum TaxID=320322 RepID=A0A9E7I1C0_9LILI|nr:RING [Musa troglodytarum]